MELVLTFLLELSVYQLSMFLKRISMLDTFLK